MAIDKEYIANILKTRLIVFLIVISILVFLGYLIISFTIKSLNTNKKNNDTKTQNLASFVVDSLTDKKITNTNKTIEAICKIYNDPNSINGYILQIPNTTTNDSINKFDSSLDQSTCANLYYKKLDDKTIILSNINLKQKDSLISKKIDLIIKEKRELANQNILTIPSNISTDTNSINVYLKKLAIDEYNNRLLNDFETLKQNNVIIDTLIEPDYLLQLDITPNDTFFNKQWGLKNTGQDQGVIGEDIAFLDAIESVKNQNRTIVAVVDTGVDYNQADLGGCSGQNCVVLDGYDFVNNDSDAMDDHGHGTFIAGIIAAKQDNKGITGICSECKILPIKVMSKDEFGSLSDVLEGIKWSVKNNAKIINISSSMNIDSNSLKQTIESTYNSGILIVASAGDMGETNKRYPAAYEKVLAVSSINNKGEKSWFSNFGYSWVDIAAPGENILSILSKNNVLANRSKPKAINDNNSTYAYLSGTSFAAPFVTGVAGLVYSNRENDSLPANAILNHLVFTARASNSSNVGVVLNAKDAVEKSINTSTQINNKSQQDQNDSEGITDNSKTNTTPDNPVVNNPVTTPQKPVTSTPKSPTSNGTISKSKLTSPTNTNLSSTKVTFKWQNTGSSEYWLWIGDGNKNDKERSNMYDKSLGRSTSVTISNLPNDGRKLYVSLYTKMKNDSWEGNKYTFNAYKKSSSSNDDDNNNDDDDNNDKGNNNDSFFLSEITQPANNSTFSSTTVTFKWKSSSGINNYSLWVGDAKTNDDTRKNIFSKTGNSALELSVSGLPSDGRKVYVRLWTYYNNKWDYNDYEYSSYKKPADDNNPPDEDNSTEIVNSKITFPASNSTLTAPAVVFAWSDAKPGKDKYGKDRTLQEYQLDIKKNGGSFENVYKGKNTSVGVTSLPTNGSNIEARLWTIIGEQEDGTLKLIRNVNTYSYKAYTQKDTESPNVDIANPSGGQEVSGVLTIKTMAIDNVKVSSHKILIDNTGNPIYTLKDCGAVPGCTADIDINNLDLKQDERPDYFVIVVEAVDSSGNKGRKVIEVKAKR